MTVYNILLTILEEITAVPYVCELIRIRVFLLSNRESYALWSQLTTQMLHDVFSIIDDVTAAFIARQLCSLFVLQALFHFMGLKRKVVAYWRRVSDRLRNAMTMVLWESASRVAASSYLSHPSIFYFSTKMLHAFSSASLHRSRWPAHQFARIP
jgi:hypothetical protein